MSHVSVETHTREHHCTYSTVELQNIVAWALADAAEIDLDRSGVEFSVKFTAEAGGMTATVTIVEDLMPQTVDVDAVR